MVYKKHNYGKSDLQRQTRSVTLMPFDETFYVHEKCKISDFKFSKVMQQHT